MGTRALIAHEGKYIYLHWDGYPSNVLPKLEKHTPETLIALGNLSALGDTIETCDAYHRDHSNELSIGTFADIAELRDKAMRCDAEYIYLFEGNKWKEV